MKNSQKIPCRLSIVVPLRNAEKYLRDSVESMLAQDYPKELTEFLFVDGRSIDGTPVILREYAAAYPFIRLLDNPDKTAPYALNIGIREAQGDYIIRLDAHSIYPSDYFSSLIYWIEKLDADNVGGQVVSSPVRETPKTIAIATVMNDRMGVGNSLFRIGTDEVCEADSVPFGCFKRELFEKIGYFDERLTRNQDIEFNKRLKRNGGKVMLIPDIRIAYIPRDNFKDFVGNRYMTGFWVVNTSFLTGTLKNLSMRHFIPLLFVGSVLGSLLLSLLFRPFILLFAFITLLYIVVMSARAVFIRHKGTSSFMIFVAFAVLHFSYGTGSIVALAKNLFTPQRVKK